MDTEKGLFSIEQLSEFILNSYGFYPELSPLPGELDLNFLVRHESRKFIFKLANPAETRENLELQHATMDQIIKSGMISTSTVIPSTGGKKILDLEDGTGSKRFARLLTWIDGEVLAKYKPHNDTLLGNLGKSLGELSASLQGFDHPAAHRFMKWDPAQTMWVEKHLDRFSGEHREIAEYFFQLFCNEVLPLEAKLRKGVNYNDANDYNVLVKSDGSEAFVPGVIDFGDVTFTWVVNEPAIALAYVLMDKKDPLEAAHAVISGYHRTFPLSEYEMSVLFPLVAARLLISVVCSELNKAEHPENVYLQISDKPAWDLLKKLRQINPVFAQAVVRSACGLEPYPQRKEFDAWLRSTAVVSHPVAAIPQLIQEGKIHWLDLGIGSTDMGTMSEIHDAVKLNVSVSEKMKELRTEFILGRYNEYRAIYTTDAYKVDQNDGPAWRTLHTGLDIFGKPGTPVLAAASGIIHSVRNNDGIRDYGPTIILEHEWSSGKKYYTLYGHLSTFSLNGIDTGMPVNAGQVIGAIGAFNENGNWPPHLHFQVILNLLGQQGDFPGVATPFFGEVFKSICPDPWIFLTDHETPALPSKSKDDIVAYRRRHLGKNMSISYRHPLVMLRGDRQYLIDSTGRRFLDTVNNVAHVGHEHPRVVRAGQKQMAVLNTNTRYLHENLVNFTEAILETMPPSLNVAFFVNSGSEANELAIRLARTVTGRKDMIVSKVGYHGNTNACVEVSSYKFDGPGGRGAQPHIHVVPIPDTYRGLYRSPDSETGMKYAAHVGGAISQIRHEGRGVAALIFESVISCGGQVELPENFLKESYRMVRAAGGFCIADEVQTGCGRAGTHFWAFEQHDVVPDIVTIGKPIGNGHPLGVVVTTQAIADAFKNGMEYFNTFGGNPVSCAIGLEVLRVIRDEELQQKALITGNYLKAGLRSLMKEFPLIGDVRGPGLFIGFELVTDPDLRTPATEQASRFANRMKEKGILMSTDGPFNNVLKIKPPMVFSIQDADLLLECTREVLQENYFKV